MPSTGDYALLAFPPEALLLGAYRRFGNLVIANKWNDLCQCNAGPGGPITCNSNVPWNGTTLTSNTPGGPDCIGITFVPNTGSEIDKVHLYIGAGWVNDTTIYLWDDSTHALLHSQAWPHSALAAGDNVLTLSPVWPITTGHSYSLTVDAYGGAWYYSSPSAWTNNTAAAWNGGVYTPAYGSYPGIAQPTLGRAIWPEICGNYPVIPPDPTPPAQPTDWPVYPGPSACASFNDICVAIGQLQGKLSSMMDEIRILQRYRVPFGLVPGTVHVGLSGSGSLSIGGLRGVSVLITAPPSPGTWPGNPPYVKDQGWLSIDSPTGMLAEKRVTQTSFYWLHDAMQLATRFQWALNPGVVINVTELLPEP